MAQRKTPMYFMLRALFVALPVLFPVIVFYIVADPYMALGRYDTYFPDPDETSLRVGVNKGMATLSNYEKQVAAGRDYNAFIFGSSISCYYDPGEWADILGDDARPYHFDSSGETLVQMAQKAGYLDRRGEEIKYALVVLDPLVMQGKDKDSPFAVNPPELDGSLAHLAKFHYTCFRAAMNMDFLKSYICSAIVGEPREIGRNRIFEDQPIVYDPVTNHESVPRWDSIIARDPATFYAEHPLMPSPAGAGQTPPAIDEESDEALRSMARIFREHGTDYQVIIGPNRRKAAINSHDLRTLTGIFGKRRVHDFSKTWAGELETDTLLYDNVHYRPVFASRLLRAVYGR